MMVVVNRFHFVACLQRDHAKEKYFMIEKSKRIKNKLKRKREQRHGKLLTLRAYIKGDFGKLLQERVSRAAVSFFQQQPESHFLLASIWGFRSIAPFISFSTIMNNLRLVNRQLSAFILVMSTNYMLTWGLRHHFVSLFNNVIMFLI